MAATTIGAVPCNLPVFYPTHYALKLGETVTCTISDPDLVVNGPVDVNIQSTDFGNTTVGGTGNTATHTITFTYKAVQNGCNTSAITYDKSFQRQLMDAPQIDRLNLGPVPTIQLDWLQPHEGNIVEFLFRPRAFQARLEKVAV